MQMIFQTEKNPLAKMTTKHMTHGRDALSGGAPGKPMLTAALWGTPAASVMPVG